MNKPHTLYTLVIEIVKLGNQFIESTWTKQSTNQDRCLINECWYEEISNNTYLQINFH